MSKLKKQPANQKLNELYRDFDKHTLTGALKSLQGHVGFELFMAYVHLEQETHEKEALAYARLSSSPAEAAAASGISEGLRQVREDLLPKWVKFLEGATGYVEDVRPEEDEEEVAAER